MPSTILPETPIPTIIDQEIHVTSLNLQQRLKKNIPKVPSKNTEIPITKANLIHPIIVSSSEATPEIAPNKEMSTSSTYVSDGQGTASNNSYPSSTKGASDGKPTSDGIEIINANSLDRLPEYPGGIAKFYAYVGSNFEKPEIEDHESIRVVVYFIIEKDGSMTSIQVKSDPGQGIGKEAIRVLKSLKTKWSPGMVNSKAVRTAYSLPITIMLE